MVNPFKIYVGFDKKDTLAYEVCVASLIKHSTIDLEIIPIHEWKLRQSKLYWRSYICDTSGQFVDRSDRSKFSTDFSFTRFLVPAINGYKDEWVLFIDPDTMWRGDIANLVECIDNQYAVMCVQHNHVPFETSKMFGLEQAKYARKNWSSVMLMNTERCRYLTTYVVNNWSGDKLHSFQWVDDYLIGKLEQKWNYLEGYTDPASVTDPLLVHFTLGTPDMLNVETQYAREWLDYTGNVLPSCMHTVHWEAE